MSTATLTPNAEIRTGSHNGFPSYALTNDKGEAKFTFKCGFCKKSHHVWLPAHVHPRCHEVCADYGWQAVVIAHIAVCEAAQAKLAAWRDNGTLPTDRVAKYLDNLVNTYANYHPSVFTWVKRSDGGHECSAKCQNACGKICECKCRGRNHGGNQ